MSQRQLKRKEADRIADLEERVRVLEAENAALKHQLANYRNWTEDGTVAVDLGSIPDHLKHGEHYANLVGVEGAIPAGFSSMVEENPSTGRSCNRDDGDVDVDVDAESEKVNRCNMISVPKKCFKPDTEIRLNADLVNLLETLRYWMVDTLPDSVIGYALSGSFRCVAKDFWVDMPALRVLWNVASKGFEGGINGLIIGALEEHAPPEIMHYLFVHHDTETKLRQEVVIRAAKLGSLECMQYILSKGRCDELGPAICEEAARSGQFDCLKYAHEHGCPWNHLTCQSAAAGGHLDCLKYAHQHGCPWSASTCEAAATGGHLNCLKYAHEQDCPWYMYTCQVVASRGYLDCLEYAHEHGCPWRNGTTFGAACYGHFACLKYAHEHGCPWDKNTCEFASMRGHLDCLKYAREHGCPS